MQIVGTIQALYAPLSDGVYPEMIKNKNIGVIKKIIKVFMPIVILGCVIAYFFAPLGFTILGGMKYGMSVTIFRLLIPCLFFGFLAIIFGFPVLGAINKQKQVTMTTIISIIFNILVTVLLIMTNNFTLISIAILRSATEVVLFISRFLSYYKYRNEFKGGVI